MILIQLNSFEIFLAYHLLNDGNVFNNDDIINSKIINMLFFMTLKINRNPFIIVFNLFKQSVDKSALFNLLPSFSHQITTGLFCLNTSTKYIQFFTEDELVRAEGRCSPK